MLQFRNPSEKDLYVLPVVLPIVFEIDESLKNTGPIDSLGHLD